MSDKPNRQISLHLEHDLGASKLVCVITRAVDPSGEYADHADLAWRIESTGLPAPLPLHDDDVDRILRFLGNHTSRVERIKGP